MNFSSVVVLVAIKKIAYWAEQTFELHLLLGLSNSCFVVTAFLKCKVS